MSIGTPRRLGLGALGAACGVLLAVHTADAASILFYNFCTYTEINCGYENDHYDDDLAVILAAAGHSLDIRSRDQTYLTPELLAPYDQLWIVTAGGINLNEDPVQPDEVAAVLVFHSLGRGIAIFGEHDYFYGAANAFALPLGARFTTSGVSRVGTNLVSTFVPSPLWENATSLGGALSEGVVVSLSPDVEIVANVLGGMIAVRETPSRVVFDGSFVRLFDAAYEPDFFTSATNQDNEIYLQNLANWLTSTPPVSVSGASWGRMKSAYR